MERLLILLDVDTNSKYGDMGWWGLPASLGFIALGIYMVWDYYKKPRDKKYDVYPFRSLILGFGSIIAGIFFVYDFIKWVFKL